MQTLNRSAKDHRHGRGRLVLGAGLVGALLLAVLPSTMASAATATIGADCAKANVKAKVKVGKSKVTLTCKKAATRLVWTDTRVINLSIIANAIKGGKSAAQAEWLQDYIAPNFTQDSALKGYNVRVRFVGRGVGDEDYKAQLALDLRSGSAADVLNIDGIWVGEFADAGYIKPLQKVVGSSYAKWDGWAQIDSTVQELMSYKGQRYGIPAGTDGRILYFNRNVFKAAGLPDNWQPNSWADILSTAATIKAKVPGVTPIQIDAGTGMGEATTMQGVLPLLVGTGERIYYDQTGRWTGNTAGIRKVLGFYSDIYNGGLGNKTWQLTKDGRDQSFKAFADGKVGILGEGDYGWRGVWNPDTGDFPMKDRATTIGWAKIPAVSPGQGIRRQSFVSMSGGGGFVLNPKTRNATWAWNLLTYMNSRDAIQASLAGSVKISQRADVNSYISRADPLINFIVKNVMPLTAYRPGFAVYPQVSAALQAATEDVVNGATVTKAAADYQSALVKLVGASKVTSN